MKSGNVHFVDSINFLPFALDKLPKMFGFKALKKGFYPHFFNTLGNLYYIGDYPSIEMYGVNTMTEEKQKIFLEWYELKRGEIFDNLDELISYCKSDVTILRSSCIKFMQNFIDTTTVNPFTEAITLASAAMVVFRKNFLRENMLGIIPRCGYRKQGNFSFISVKWLCYENRKVNGKIISAYTLAEKKLEKCGLWVDGFNSETNTVYEFFGCYYHGCVKCYQNREWKHPSNPTQTMHYTYTSTLRRLEKIKKSGFQVVHTWECEFVQFLHNHPDIDRELNEELVDFVEKLNPRDALYGGRTELFKIYHKCNKNEKIRYYDFTSLYPYVNKYAPYPIGHPEILLNEEIPALSEVIQYHGFLKCLVLPPTDLQIPVLPYRVNEKLYFPLCRSCTEHNQAVIECSHSAEERMIFGTWIIPEIKLAVSHGYEIIRMYEIWKYDHIQYDPSQKHGGLFSEYVNTFLAIKQQSSGWPDTCNTLVKQKQYIEKYFDREDIVLDVNKVSNNPGMRTLAKLLLNSLWGKFAQSETKSKSSIITSYKQLVDLVNNPGIEINSICLINEDCMWVSWKNIDQNITRIPYSNVPIGAYTTAYARIKLYEELFKRQDSLLYCDTDSVIFIDNLTEEVQNVSEGEFLGELNDELSKYGENAFISEFVSIGPKSYSLQIQTENGLEYITKCKGIGLSSQNSKLANFENFKSMVLGDLESEILTTKDLKIVRKKPGVIVSREELKNIRFTFIKRVVKDDYSTYPYGFKKIKYNN